MKRHNNTVKHLLEAKRFKESTMQTNTLWDITPTEERYLTFIDQIANEQIQPKPANYFKVAPPLNNGPKLIEIPLERNGLTKDPRPGIGIYKKIKVKEVQWSLVCLNLKGSKNKFKVKGV